MARRSWDDPWHHYAESRPLPPVDGIATSRQRGAMAESWWSKRFVDVLDSYGLGSRMKRGRRYARSGQVLSLEVTSGLLLAQVQGSRRTPYVVAIRVDVPVEAAWSELRAALQAKVGFVARLLDGDVPPELEDACAGAGVALFPTSWSQLTANCSCPDWENPCKHLAAALYVFADQLDTDPWLLFTWRGRTRDELLAHLDALSAPRGGDDLPSWWLPVPGRTDPERVRWRPPNPNPPEPAHQVLARLAPLDATHGGTPIDQLVVAAYPVLIQADDET